MNLALISLFQLISLGIPSGSSGNTDSLNCASFPLFRLSYSSMVRYVDSWVTESGSEPGEEDVTDARHRGDSRRRGAKTAQHTHPIPTFQSEET